MINANELKQFQNKNVGELVNLFLDKEVEPLLIKAAEEGKTSVDICVPTHIVQYKTFINDSLRLAGYYTAWVKTSFEREVNLTIGWGE